MTSDLGLVFVCVLLVVGGFSLLAAWLRDFSNLLWMLALRRAVVLGSALVSASVVYALGYWATPVENLVALRVLAIILFAPLVARPLADSFALAISRRWTLTEARPYLNDIGQQATALAVSAVIVFVITLVVAPGLVWAGPRIVLVLVAAPLGRRPVHRLARRALEKLGDRASSRGHVFDAVATQQQETFLASLEPAQGGEPFGDANDLFDLVEPGSLRTPPRP